MNMRTKDNNFNVQPDMLLTLLSVSGFNITVYIDEKFLDKNTEQVKAAG